MLPASHVLDGLWARARRVFPSGLADLQNGFGTGRTECRECGMLPARRVCWLRAAQPSTAALRTAAPRSALCPPPFPCFPLPALAQQQKFNGYELHGRTLSVKLDQHVQ